MNLVQDSASVIMPSQHRYVRVVHPNISTETRISSQALPARHLQLAKLEQAIVDESDQVQGCASEEAGSNLTTALKFFHFESLFYFPGLLWMQTCTEPPSSEGAVGGVHRLSSCIPTAKTTMSVLVPKHYMFRRGCVWKYEHVQWTSCRCSPPGDASCAERGRAVRRDDAK